MAILVALVIFLAYRMRLNRWAAYAASILLLLVILDKQIWLPVLRFPFNESGSWDPLTPIFR